MKKRIVVALSFFFLLATAVPAISGNHGHSPHGPDDKNRPDNPAPHKHQQNPDYHQYRGYSEKPYDKHRHYHYHNYKGHQYTYRGHWRSWNEWEKYEKKHRHQYKNGKYYRENEHLMFRFCDPDSGEHFFFSIGK